MIFKRYIDVNLGNDKYIDNVRIDTDILKDDILTISPMINNYGAKLKNVTLMIDRYGNHYKVVGKYMDIIEKVRNNTERNIGF